MEIIRTEPHEPTGRISNMLEFAEEQGYTIRALEFTDAYGLGLDNARDWAVEHLQGADYDITRTEHGYEVHWAERDGVLYNSGPSFAEQHRQRLAFHRFVTY